MNSPKPQLNLLGAISRRNLYMQNHSSITISQNGVEGKGGAGEVGRKEGDCDPTMAPVD